MVRLRIRSSFTSRKVVVIDPDRCRKCSLCIKACPLGALEGRPGVVPAVNETLCIGCGICVEACPFGAMSLVWRRSLLPVATVAVILALAVLAGALVYLTQPGGGEAGVGAAEPVGGGVIELPYEEAAGEQPPPEYYAALEEEAGTEGG